MNKIKFNQPKYVLGVFSYFGCILIGGLVYWVVDTDIEETKQDGLQSTEYLNAELPSANVRDEIGSKRRNVQDAFGNIIDQSGLQNIENDIDSVKKKEEFDSRYSEDELDQIEKQNAQAEEIARLREMLAKMEESKKRSEQISDDGYDLDISEEERARIYEERRRREMEEIEQELGRIRSTNQGIESSAVSQEVETDTLLNQRKAITQPKDQEPSEVTKVTTTTSQYFNTISPNTQESHLIKAIVDEEVKVVEGSRIRLRILDDIEIKGTRVSKGSYLYAEMSGFSKQRIQGTIKSLMVGDELLTINLTIYDTDGLEGLYVPSSSFRETAQDVASSAMSSNMSMDNNSMGNGNFAQWAMQGVQNAYQRTSSAIAKALKKNKVRVKYGTMVYLINNKEKKR